MWAGQIFSRYSGDECRRCRGRRLIFFYCRTRGDFRILQTAPILQTTSCFMRIRFQPGQSPWKCLSDLSDWNSRTVRAVGIFRTICRDFCRLLVDGTCRNLNVFPIFMRRARIVRYAVVFILMLALGKGISSRRTLFLEKVGNKKAIMILFFRRERAGYDQREKFCCRNCTRRYR